MDSYLKIRQCNIPIRGNGGSEGLEQDGCLAYVGPGLEFVFLQ